MPFQCSICGEESTRICARCTKDACDNHLCEKCRRCSDCCECEIALSPQAPETVREVIHPEPHIVPEPPAVPVPEPPSALEPPPQLMVPVEPELEIPSEAGLEEESVPPLSETPSSELP